MTRLAVVELHKEEFSFSAGHFTIFSASEREDLHGHNYNVSVLLQVLIRENGMAFDYRFYKNKIQTLCQMLDRRFLLPSLSKYLTLEDADDMWFAHFHHERIPFLKRDVMILPICNVTIEELSHWFLQRLTEDSLELKTHGIETMTVKVYNGPGQSGAATLSKGGESFKIN